MVLRARFPTLRFIPNVWYLWGGAIIVVATWRVLPNWFPLYGIWFIGVLVFKLTWICSGQSHGFFFVSNMPPIGAQATIIELLASRVRIDCGMPMPFCSDDTIYVGMISITKIALNLVMESMPNFKDVQRLQLVFKTSIQVTAITQQVAHHLTLSMELIPVFTLTIYVVWTGWPLYPCLSFRRMYWLNENVVLTLPIFLFCRSSNDR